jgi:hypothetical protein
VAGVSGMEKLLGVVSVGNLGWDRTISRLLVAFKTINIMVVHAIVSRTWGELAWIEIDDRLMHWRRTRRASASLVCYCFCSLSNLFKFGPKFSKYIYRQVPKKNSTSKKNLVSTVSSESTFSTVGRIIEERRSSLAPDMVEALTCLKDWEAADTRQQHQLEDQEIAQAMADLELEDDE